MSIPAKPERIITASVGHDEVVLALAPGDRLVAVGNPTKSETFSNVASLVQDKPEVTRDPETIIAQSPDVIVTSPFFPAEGVEALSRIGIPVVQTALQHDPEARIDNILLIGYILGEEERALEFAAEVRERYDALVAITGRRNLAHEFSRLRSTRTSYGWRVATRRRAASSRLPAASTRRKRPGVERNQTDQS